METETTQRGQGLPVEHGSAVCPFADAVARRIVQRAAKGKEKYGVTCERTDLDLHQWLTHLQEELMDAVVYIERSKFEIWREKEGVPACPTCGNNRQVWVNQITRKLTCHRAGCHREISEPNSGGVSRHDVR